MNFYNWSAVPKNGNFERRALSGTENATERTTDTGNYFVVVRKSMTGKLVNVDIEKVRTFTGTTLTFFSVTLQGTNGDAHRIRLSELFENIDVLRSVCNRLITLRVDNKLDAMITFECLRKEKKDIFFIKEAYERVRG